MKHEYYKYKRDLKKGKDKGEESKGDKGTVAPSFGGEDLIVCDDNYIGLISDNTS